MRDLLKKLRFTIIVSYYEPILDVSGKAKAFDAENCFALQHFHRAIEYIFILEGKARIFDCEFIRDFSAGEIAFIPSYHAHSLTPIEHSVTRTLILPAALTKRAERVGSLVFFALDDKAFNKKLFNVSEKFVSAEALNNELVLGGYADVLLGLTIERYPPLSPNEKHVALIGEIIKYLDERFTEPLTLESVAERFGFSKYYFSRLFHKFFACNFNVYLNRLRVRYVKEHSDEYANFTDSIFAAGFNQTSTFYQFVKRDDLTKK